MVVVDFLLFCSFVSLSTLYKLLSYFSFSFLYLLTKTMSLSYRILVLDAGQIAEFDEPQTLLQNPNSIFYGMAKDAGLVWESAQLQRLNEWIGCAGHTHPTWTMMLVSMCCVTGWITQCVRLWAALRQPALQLDVVKVIKRTLAV